MAHLITASSGTPHITPKNDAVIHRGMMGVESCILDYGEKLAPMLVPAQPTNIRILDGCGMMQGRFFEIEEGSYDTVAIPNGAQGYSRIDLVCAKITQNESGTQTFSWQVVQGTQTAGTPTPPTVEEHSLDDGDEFALMPIASVELEGVNIVAVETVAEIGRTVSDDIRKVVPLREGEFMEVKELLWTNPASLTSPFLRSSVTLNKSLANYDCIEITYVFNVNALRMRTERVELEYGGTMQYGYGSNQNWSRDVDKTSDTQITIDNAVIQGVKQDNLYLIPHKIYGIRKIGDTN